jgi:hypothetical protein
MSVQQSHGMPQIDPTMMTSPRTRVSELQRSDINQMSSGQLAKGLGVVPEDRDAWNKLVPPPPLNIPFILVWVVDFVDARYQSVS